MKNTQEAIRRPDHTIATSSRDIAEHLLNTLIPSDPGDKKFELDNTTKRESYELTEYEVKTVIWRITRKAPGTNGICARILRKAWPTAKKEIIITLKKCMMDCAFPDKRQRPDAGEVI